MFNFKQLKFDLNIWVNPGLSQPAFEQPAPGAGCSKAD